jgi:hypothetical protein
MYNYFVLAFFETGALLETMFSFFVSCAYHYNTQANRFEESLGHLRMIVS